MNTKLAVCMGVFSIGTTLAIPVFNPGNGHYYDIVTLDPAGGQITWDNARAAAEIASHLGAAGHLATITSQEERDFIIGAFPEVTVGTGLGGYLLGARQIDTSGGPADGWGWVTGEAFIYTNWATGEPNDFGGNSEDYLATHDFIGANPLALWNDNAGFGSGYIIEFSGTSVPDGGSTALLAGLAMVGLAWARRKAPAQLP